MKTCILIERSLLWGFSNTVCSHAWKSSLTPRFYALPHRGMVWTAKCTQLCEELAQLCQQWNAEVRLRSESVVWQVTFPVDFIQAVKGGGGSRFLAEVTVRGKRYRRWLSYLLKKKKDWLPTQNEPSRETNVICKGIAQWMLISRDICSNPSFKSQIKKKKSCSCYPSTHVCFIKTADDLQSVQATLVPAMR